MEILKAYALSFVGVPYIWGGAHPAFGLDCSGFVQVVLRSAGEDPPGDQSAQAIFDHFEAGMNGSRVAGPQTGTLAFFGKSSTQITHIGFCLDQYRMVHASGGDSTCVSVEAAIKKEAFIRVDLISYRKDLVGFLKPYYRKIGMI